MKNPFKEGDVFYHYKHGKGIVHSRTVSGENLWVRLNDDDDLTLLSYKDLSFKPWPAPCHERPIEDGWWMVSLEKTQHIPRLRHVFKGEVYNEVGDKLSSRCTDYTFHRYLGKDWK